MEKKVFIKLKNMLTQKIINNNAVVLKIDEENKNINLFNRMYLTFEELDEKGWLELIVDAYAYGLYKGREEKEQEQERQKDKNEKNVKELLKNIIVLLHDENSKYWD